jgi:hypothetical protein
MREAAKLETEKSMNKTAKFSIQWLVFIVFFKVESLIMERARRNTKSFLTLQTLAQVWKINHEKSFWFRKSEICEERKAGKFDSFLLSSLCFCMSEQRTNS